MTGDFFESTKVARVRRQGALPMLAVIIDVEPEHVERIVGPLGPRRDVDAIGRSKPDVIDQILPHVRTIMHNRNVEGIQGTRRADSGDHQQLRRL